MDVLDARGEYTPQQLNKLLMRLLAGSKKRPEAPKPVHVLDCLRKMDEKIPGVLSSYDSRLRNVTFFALAECNAAIAVAVEQHRAGATDAELVAPATTRASCWGVWMDTGRIACP